ncbi:hypothetical protein MMC30_000584, partial [Trapelia coarctata]|nr:hypothetical protein [Trapelia coarctata]
THPAAGLQTEVRPTVRSVAPSNHSSRIRRGRKKHDKKGGKTSNDRGCESWKVPLPSTEASNADWTKPRHSSDTGSEVDWSPVDSKKDNKTAEWINSLSADDKDEGHDTGNDRGYWANDSSIRARRNTDSSQTRMRNNSRGERKLWNQGPDGHTNNRDSSGEWVGPNGSAKKDSGWNADKSRNETGRHLSWENEPKQSSPPVRTTITPAWAPIGHVSPKSPRLRSTSQLSQPFPGAWPRSRTPSPVRQEQTHKWSPPPDAVERLPMQPVRQEQTHRRPSLQDAVGRPQTEPVQPSWGGSTPEGPPKPMVGMGAELSSHHKSTGWSNMPLNVPAEMLHYPGNQIHNTPPASFAASRKLSLSRSMSRLGARSPSKITAKSRARSKSVARPRANTTASQDKSSKSPINKLLSELKDSKDLRSVFDPNATDSPLYTVPEEVIKRKDVTHQVNAGRTAAYFHRMSTPKYIDSHDDPYAVFVFKYRSKAALERMLNIEVIELEESERRRLMELSKDELIEQYLKAKAQADLKANIGNFDELDEATDKLDGIQLDQEEENDAPKGNDEAWGSWAGGGSTAGGWATDGQTVKSGNNGPSWGGNNEQNKNHANNSQGNGRLSWGGDDGRDRSRSTHHRSVHNSAGHGGNGPFAWGGDDEVNENHSNNGNSNGGLSWNGDNGRDRSRSTHYRSEHSGAGNGGNGHIAWGGDDEVNQTHSYNSQGNSGLSGPGKNGRDQSRSSQHRPVQGGAGHGGNAPLAWGGEQGRNQSQSSNGNTTTFRTASSNHGRYSSRDTNHRQNQGGGWAGDRDRSWGGETVNNGRRSDAGGNTGRVAEADVDW